MSTDNTQTTEQTIKVTIVTSRGPDAQTMAMSKALELIRNEINAHKRWLYVDGIQTNLDEIDIKKLASASDITLMNAIIGG